MSSANKTLISHLKQLNHQLQGDVLVDPVSCMLYATDASIYQQRPLAVARPQNKHDCATLLRFCEKNNVPLIPRAGGTSLAGQLVGEAVIVDVSRYMTRILSLDIENQTATVEPGVILDSLNRRVAQYNLKFAPDPSTLNRATISGVIGNNAWGAHSPLYGSTRDHILKMEIMLTSGDLVLCEALTEQRLINKQLLKNPEGEIYRNIIKIITQQKERIARQFPEKNLICNSGYALHELYKGQPWRQNGPLFNLSNLVCGSEGTLAFVTEATVNLCKIPKHSVTICSHFHSLNDALLAVPIAVAAQASAVELLDDYLIKLTGQNIEQRRNRFWIKNDPQAILIIEFCGDNLPLLHDKAATLIQTLQNNKLGFYYPTLTPPKSQSVWAIRRAALGLLMGMKGDKQTPSFIEDSAVPVENLAEFVIQVQSLMKHHETQCVYYGSVSMGLVHLRPLLNLHQQQDRKLLTVLAKAVAVLLKRFNGTMSAKHGDGRVRGGFIEQFFDKQIIDCLHSIKSCFDPHFILNPGKIVNPVALAENFRYQDVESLDISPGFKWENSSSQPLLSAAERCNGAAVCRKQAGNGVMCPSYMATGEELHSTRGRANIIRQVLQTQSLDDSSAIQAISTALELCVSCKGCRSECPANVDMARLKSELLYQIHQKRGGSSKLNLLVNLECLSRFAGIFPFLSNKLLSLNTIKKIHGYHKKRSLPRLARVRLSRWHAQRPKNQHADQGQIVILNDVFSEYYEVDIGKAAIKLLERLGFDVVLSPCLPSLRTVISQGLLDLARDRLIHNAEYLYNHARNQTAIVGLEPSELLTYRDEAIDLNVPPQYLEKIKAISTQCFLFEEIIVRHKDLVSEKLNFKEAHTGIALHVHCHQKSLSDTSLCTQTLKLIPNATVQTIPSGCCGMAGVFGYERQHYETSKSIAELVLLPFIRQLPQQTVVVATGASCRQQIKDLINRNAYHCAQVLYQHLN